MAVVFRPNYPMPDRSRQTIHHVKDDDGVIDVGWCDGVMSDGRAFRAEMWAQDGVSMLTFFFSRIGIAHLDQDQIKALIVAEGLVTFRPGREAICSSLPCDDDAGAEMWSVNVVVGDEDGSFLDGSVPIWRYGETNTMFNSVPLWAGREGPRGGARP